MYKDVPKWQEDGFVKFIKVFSKVYKKYFVFYIL